MEDRRLVHLVTISAVVAIAIMVTVIMHANTIIHTNTVSTVEEATPTMEEAVSAKMVEAYACGYHIVINGTEVIVKYDGAYAGRLRMTFDGTHVILGCEID